jgi:hypothetical protein
VPGQAEAGDAHADENTWPLFSCRSKAAIADAGGDESDVE